MLTCCIATSSWQRYKWSARDRVVGMTPLNSTYSLQQTWCGIGSALLPSPPALVSMGCVLPQSVSLPPFLLLLCAGWSLSLQLCGPYHGILQLFGWALPEPMWHTNPRIPKCYCHNPSGANISQYCLMISVYRSSQLLLAIFPLLEQLQ